MSENVEEQTKKIIDLIKSNDLDKLTEFLKEFNGKVVELNEKMKQVIEGYEDEIDATTDIHIGRLDI